MFYLNYLTTYLQKQNAAMKRNALDPKNMVDCRTSGIRRFM